MAVKTSMIQTEKRATCDQCMRPSTACYCHTITQINNKTPIFILQDKLESKHPIGTARIAQLTLSQCEIIEIENIEYWTQIVQQINPVLLFPASNAMALSATNASNDRPLLLLDSTWPKARRMLHEHAILKTLDKALIHPQAAPRYTIRKSPTPGGYSTIEAIAYALHELEAQSTPLLMLNTLDWVVNHQREKMGEDKFKAHYL